MPNIAAQFGESSNLCFFQGKMHNAQGQQLVALFQDLGTAPIIDEKLMDAAATVLPSGTAHLRCAIFFYAGRY
jgi:pyrroline-5-carboxylate reductase